MRKIYLSLLLVLCVTFAYAQDGNALKFEKTTHDFGDLQQGKPQDYVFKFTNTSARPIKLTLVKASCGCTTPSYTKDAIGPNQTGEIKVQYNAAKGGMFNKTVRVEYDSLADKATTLTIKGNVVVPPGEESQTNMVLPPKPVINYSVPRGALAFEKMIENVQEVTSENSATIEFRFKNVSDKDVRILDDISTDPEVTVVAQDKLLKPGQESKITVTVDGRKLKASNTTSGFFSKAITLHTDESAEADKRMTVNGTFKRIITEAEKASSPKIVFETIEVDGGKVIEGENWVYDFKFTNQGKGNLVIENAKASCGCTATAPPKGEIAPGASSAITASFNSTGRVGTQSKTITVTTNDVENPVITLKFKVEVVKDPFHSGGMMNTNQ